MGIKFLNGGFLTTIQDMGRTGYQESGMSVSGVMDQRSAALANILVGKIGSTRLNSSHHLTSRMPSSA